MHDRLVGAEVGLHEFLDLIEGLGHARLHRRETLEALDDPDAVAARELERAPGHVRRFDRFDLVGRDLVEQLAWARQCVAAHEQGRAGGERRVELLQRVLAAAAVEARRAGAGDVRVGAEGPGKTRLAGGVRLLRLCRIAPGECGAMGQVQRIAASTESDDR